MSHNVRPRCKAFDLCTCCTQLIVEGGVQEGGKWFCDTECVRAHKVYRKLCGWAKRKAQRFEKREIDMTKAQAFLAQHLQNRKTSRTKILVLTPV